MALLGFFEFGPGGESPYIAGVAQDTNPVIASGMYTDNCATCLKSQNVSASSAIEKAGCRIVQTTRAPISEHTTEALAICGSACGVLENHGIGLDPFN
jgi:hypothetical protein